MPIHEDQYRQDSEGARATPDDDAQLMECVTTSDGVRRGYRRSPVSILNFGAVPKHKKYNKIIDEVEGDAYFASRDWAPGMPCARSNLKPKPWPIQPAGR